MHDIQRPWDSGHHPTREAAGVTPPKLWTGALSRSHRAGDSGRPASPTRSRPGHSEASRNPAQVSGRGAQPDMSPQGPSGHTGDPGPRTASTKSGGQGLLPTLQDSLFLASCPDSPEPQATAVSQGHWHRREGQVGPACLPGRSCGAGATNHGVVSTSCPGAPPGRLKCRARFSSAHSTAFSQDRPLWAPRGPRGRPSRGPGAPRLGPFGGSWARPRL